MSDAARYARLLAKTAGELARLPLHRLDGDPQALKTAFDRVCDAGLFALYRYDPSQHEQMKFQLYTTLTPLSGTLAFLGIQILAANKIMQQNGFALRDAYLARRCGIAVNHLRAPATVVSAVRTPEGYRLTGRLTWASGCGIFDTLVAGFHCDGREMQAVIPFAPQPGLHIGETVETFVGNAMRNVDITLDAFFVPSEHIVASHPLGTYRRHKSASRTIHYALYGLGRGAIAALNDDALIAAAESGLERLKTALLAAEDGQTLDALRIGMFAFVQQTVTTGMVLQGGRAVLASETLQRYYRELLLFNANGLNSDHKALFREAFLEGLPVSPSGAAAR